MALYQGCGGMVSGDTEYDKMKELDRLEKSGEWYAEPKFDGIWCAAWMDKNGVMNYLSRNDTLKNMPQLSRIVLPPGTVLVGELAYGSQEANKRKAAAGHEFMDVFDICKYSGQDVRALPLIERRNLLIDFYQHNDDLAKWYPLAPMYETDLVKEYSAQPEGLVLKHKFDQGYKGEHWRNPQWLKAKKVFSNEYVIVDWVISSAATKSAEPMAESIHCGGYVPKSTVSANEKVYDTKLINGQEYCLVYLVSVGSMTHEMCKSVAQSFDSWRGKVIEINHFKLFSGGSCRHPSVKRDYTTGAPCIREDKSAIDCIYRV